MIEIEGAAYVKCANCLRWTPADEMVWDNEALAWVCCDPDGTTFLVV